MPFRIVYPNLADSLSVIAASSATASQPVTNLQRQRRGRIWRTQNANDATITGNWDATQSIDAFVFWRHNLSAAGTIRLRLYDGLNQTGNVLYDSGVVELSEENGWGEDDYGLFDWGGSSVFLSSMYRFISLWFAFSAVVAALSFKIDISDALNPDGHFEAVRLWLGAYTELSEDASKGSGWGWEDNSSHARTQGGSLDTENKSKFRQWEVKLGLLPEADRAALFEIAGEAGLGDDMFISLFPEVGGVKERDAAGLVKIVSMPKITSRPDGHDQYESSIIFQES